MPTNLDSEVRALLEAPNFWHLATINPDGSPQSTVVWVDVRDGKVLINTALGRKKPRNLEREPRIALSLHDPQNPYANAQIQGRVVERITGEQADRDINALSAKYTGRTPYPWRMEGEERVTYLIEPTRVWHRPGRVE
ncbi:MAG: PPOX class F420-dependent oxidoreductase [Candidatus Rokuibacteriota bacterium]|nr:MAG: PPOX class F420-dependent oxidoreductase [Candidatus Rokubacteria bacterium]